MPSGFSSRDVQEGETRKLEGDTYSVLFFSPFGASVTMFCIENDIQFDVLVTDY